VADKGFPAPEKRATTITANPNAKLAFGSAVVLLFLSGLAAVFTFANLQRSERRVDHSHAVQITLIKLASAAARAGRARMGYVLTRSEKFLPEYETNVALLPKLIQSLTELTRDNPVQRANCQRLGEFTIGRLRMWEETIKSAKNGQLTPVDAIATEQVSSFGAQVAALTDVMNAEESRLLGERESSAALHFRIVILVVALAFAGSLLLFFVHYQMLRNELEQRRAAEKTAIKSQQAARNLSVNLMRLQDEERRKFSRELHDSLGQYLVALKMNLGQIKASGAHHGPGTPRPCHPHPTASGFHRAPALFPEPDSYVGRIISPNDPEGLASSPSALLGAGACPLGPLPACQPATSIS
jgi:CHASE3 domain sensor protein